MARQKQIAPRQRVPSGVLVEPPDSVEFGEKRSNGSINKESSRSHLPEAAELPSANQPGILQLLVCVAGIYASFLSWGILQEAITTTKYTIRPPTAEIPNPQTERFTYSIVLNTIQSFFAAIIGFIYLLVSGSSGSRNYFPTVFPSQRIVLPLILVSISSSLASPFGYASLAHIDYLTFILAKSCKLLPVMFLHLTIFRKRYPLYKYGVILLVTIGVATFTIHHPTSIKKHGSTSANGNGNVTSSAYGLSLLFINLLLDGLTNTTQDHIFSSPGLYGRFTGPQMMVAHNILSTVLTTTYLLAVPHISSSILPLIPLPIPPSQTWELSSAIAFLSRHPRAAKDVFAFAACGAIGQLFIFHTLARFSSLLLVTVTVTRKMLTMLLSVVWFGHRLGRGQWVGVSLVFGGIAAEGIVQKREKSRKKTEKAKRN